MSAKRSDIPEEVRSNLLLWCGRHCCFCGRKCTTNIEIHHIDQDPKNNEEDNLVPLCFDCHGEVERYNPQHPKGSKYRHIEIKARRDQIYEEHTRKNLRQVMIRVSRYFHQFDKELRERKWPDISFTVQSLSTDIPLQLRIVATPYLNGNLIEAELDGLYRGKALWNMNPAQIIFGHLTLLLSNINISELRIEIQWSIVDILQREHNMLPFSYVLTDTNADFWYDPRIVYTPHQS